MAASAEARSPVSRPPPFRSTCHGFAATLACALLSPEGSPRPSSLESQLTSSSSRDALSAPPPGTPSREALPLRDALPPRMAMSPSPGVCSGLWTATYFKWPFKFLTCNPGLAPQVVEVPVIFPPLTSMMRLCTARVLTCVYIQRMHYTYEFLFCLFFHTAKVFFFQENCFF